MATKKHITGNDESPSGAVDQAAFEKVIRDNLSPEGVTAIIAFLRPASSYAPATDEGKQALQQVGWFADTLQAMLGVEEYNHLVDEIGL